MSALQKAYKVFYSKDVRKKKKVYSEGILLCEEKKTKIYSLEGDIIVAVNGRNNPQADEQYTINNSYVVLIDTQFQLEKFTSGQIFLEQNKVNFCQQKKQVKQKQSLHKAEFEIAKKFKNGLQIQSFIFSQLRQHQVQGVSFMYQCLTGQRGSKIQGCILADFMGLGKTLQTLTLIRSLLIKKIVTKVIVVCPLTLLKVWEKQCTKWMGSKLSPLITLGTAEQISKIIRMFTDYEYRFLITSYQNLNKYSDSLSKKCDFLIFDQGHRLKNKKSKLFRKIQTFKCKKRLLLTGTPLQNNLEELYTCITLVNPHFFQSQSIFKNIFQKPIIAGMAKFASNQSRTIAVGRTKELANLIKQFSLRRKADVLQGYLPKKRQYQVFLKPTPLQITLYQRILKKKINDNQAMSCLNQMRKLFTHPLLFKSDRFQKQEWKDCHEDCRAEVSNKMNFVLQVAQFCKSNDEKLVIVSYFTQSLDFIQQMLTQNQITSAKLDGRLEGKDRFKAVQNFIQSKTVLLLSGKAGGTGLTLICASKMIMIEPDWNPSNDSQVMGRIWRQGQQKQVQIFRLLIASSFQEKILQRQQLKQSLSQKLIDEQVNTKSYDFFSLKQLFMQLVPKCITYHSNANKLQECKQKVSFIDWSESIYVNIIESHQQNKDKLSNQFQEAEFAEFQSQKEQKQEEDAIEEDLDFQYSKQSLETSAQTEPKIKVTITKKQGKKASTITSLRKQCIETDVVTDNHKQKLQQRTIGDNLPTLPPALRKIQKKFLKLQQ